MGVMPFVSRVNTTARSARIVQPTTAAALPWYDPNGVFAADGGNLYAWRAQNSVGTIWPGGPANYAATLTDQSSGVVLVENNGAVPWVAATGWGFVAAALQSFDTGLQPVSDQSWSIFVQFSNGVATGATATLCGMNRTVGRSFGVSYSDTLNLNVVYYNGNQVSVAPSLMTGNLGVAGNQGYRNGVANGGAIGVWVMPDLMLNIYIGSGRAFAGAAAFSTADIAAVWMYDQNPALVQAQAVLANGFRAAMGQL